MLLIKLPFITHIHSVGCELPLLGGWGVLYFSEWIHYSVIKFSVFDGYSFDTPHFLQRQNHPHPKQSNTNNVYMITFGALLDLQG